MNNAQQLIESAWDNRELIKNSTTVKAIDYVIEELDKGRLRICTKQNDQWQVHTWLKKAVILYFPVKQMETIEHGPFEFHDKIPLKKDFAAQQVRVVPQALARYGSHLEPGVVMMPSYVNIGAYVGANSMVDTWATVGSCAQIGQHVHLSGGVGIGGVLEPLQAQPVIVEDHAFIGSRAILVEGVHVGEEAVIGANVTITGSTKIIDVSGDQPKEYKGYIPPKSVVIPGSTSKTFPAGNFGIPCALIIGQRKASTDKKTSLNDALRDFNLSV
ncbi:MAG: 2,3,4,5-tetrahydropyridine-2,6-dicarboxylate N-succinyltransferase [Saprospirales bacterium]|nr:2,3,4,5-tetrahydropyridine-2,6-dicarboxylate N-succinyltransferase [Saprospirales bacterium]|tara:strand:+ start:709 stop:1524 length:816 start_codon:yes stop_codon:yes gene_type:complete